jgi:hypothetical protein
MEEKTFSARFQACAVVWLQLLLFWGVMQHNSPEEGPQNISCFEIA